MMTIEVTQEDIDFGVPGESQGCAVWRALRRAGLGDCHVGAHDLHGDGFSFPLSAVARDFVERFDKNLPVAPFQFQIPIHTKTPCSNI